MSLPQRITALLESVTRNQLASMSPADAQRLSDQCERVYREIGATKIMRDAATATAPKTGVLADLRRDGGVTTND